MLLFKPEPAEERTYSEFYDRDFFYNDNKMTTKAYSFFRFRFCEHGKILLSWESKK